MARNVIERFDVGGIKVEIGPAISKDAGLVVVTRNIRGSAWFPPLVDRVLAAIAVSPKTNHGFHVRAKLEAGLLTLLLGLVMGRRNPNPRRRCSPTPDPTMSSAMRRVPGTRNSGRSSSLRLRTARPGRGLSLRNDSTLSPTWCRRPQPRWSASICSEAKPSGCSGSSPPPSSPPSATRRYGRTVYGPSW